MARANVKTWLSLDEWAEIMGFDPLAFNQLSSNSLPKNTVCGDIFFQFDWQHSDRIGRETIAQAIQEAEQEIAGEVGYNLVPDWSVAERLPYPRPSLPEAFGYGINVRGMLKSVEATKGHVISGGVKAKSLIAAGAAIVRSNLDSDSFSETCTVTVPTTVTDVNEIHAYYPSQNGDDGWEIRPIKVTLSGGNAIITFKIWQVVKADKLEIFNAQVLDADLAATYETTVDVYRIYNDPSTQLQFMWENLPDCNCGNSSCVACQLATQAGCFHLRDERMGFVVPAPGSWNASTQSFDTAEWSACREPDQIRLWYYSGNRDNSLARPYVELAPVWKKAIAFYAASKFERDVCGCSNVNQWIAKLRRDAAFSSMQEGGFNVTAEQASNRLGTTMGALYAYRQIQRPGVRVNK